MSGIVELGFFREKQSRGWEVGLDFKELARLIVGVVKYKIHQLPGISGKS